MERDASWFAGYQAALDVPVNTICTAIMPPDSYTDEQRSNFVSGFLIGARHSRDRALIDQIQGGDDEDPTIGHSHNFYMTREEMTMPATNDEQDQNDLDATRSRVAQISHEIIGVWAESGECIMAEFIFGDDHEPGVPTRAEALANAHLFKAAPRMLAHLKWLAENDGECLGDHPLMLAKIQAIIAEVEND